VFSV
jgi:histone arginine demethylase JMJD6